MKVKELLKIARRERTEFDRALWRHKAEQPPQEDFRREVEP